MDTASLGRKILFGMNVATALSGHLADFNRTHLYNPNWPPHAKFHNGLSLSLGTLLGALGLFALVRKRGDPKDNLRLAALCPAIFFGAMMSAKAYPGADTIESEFPDYWPKIGNFSLNELPFATAMLLVTALGWVSRKPARATAGQRWPSRRRCSPKVPRRSRRERDEVGSLRRAGHLLIARSHRHTAVILPRHAAGRPGCRVGTRGTTFAG